MKIGTFKQKWIIYTFLSYIFSFFFQAHWKIQTIRDIFFFLSLICFPLFFRHFMLKLFVYIYSEVIIHMLHFCIFIIFFFSSTHLFNARRFKRDCSRHCAWRCVCGFFFSIIIFFSFLFPAICVLLCHIP